ncbi:LpqB family beta-propeller domain-containing protein [Dactylosporangium salmoneum]|uniref:Lipoprotein LpqB n=1 Tax=Dactylosporangium salmoneum TaxID=53361 RepID=A0ABN3HRX2_9ACTN
MTRPGRIASWLRIAGGGQGEARTAVARGENWAAVGRSEARTGRRQGENRTGSDRWTLPGGWPARRGLLGRGAVFAGLAAALTLNGCGLPAHTDPRYAGPAHSAAPMQDEKKPPVPASATNAPDLVAQYLKASVGGNLDSDEESSPNKETRDRLRQFMTPAEAQSWSAPADGLVVVRDTPVRQTQVVNGAYVVEVQIIPIGTLSGRGEFDAQQKPDPYIARFVAEPTTNGEFRLKEAPPQLLLTETGLKSWYDWQPIYFWEANGTPAKLVPDLRYMPNTFSPAKRVSEVMRWLKLGPGQGLTGVVKGLPDNVESKDNPVADQYNQTVKVNLSSKAAGLHTDELSRLARQIRWSLLDHPRVQLRIENQDNPADSQTGFTDDNVAYTQAITNPVPERFCVTNGSVRAVVVPQEGETPLFTPGGANVQVVSAAINRQLNRAALVRQVGKAEQSLVVSAPGPVANPPVYHDTNLQRLPHLSRPAWMTYPVQRLLVSDGQHLWAGTDSTSTTLEKVTTGGLPTSQAITAFAVAPEGHRIALIAGGTVMVASLQLTSDSKLTMGQLRPIATSLGDNQGVAWLTETMLVVGGKPSTPQPNSSGITPAPYSVVGITMDGADETPLPTGSRPASQPEVNAVVARFNSPLETQTRKWDNMPIFVMVETNHVARVIYRDSIDQLNLGPAPAAAPSAEPAAPTSPFYPD